MPEGFSHQPEQPAPLSREKDEFRTDILKRAAGYIDMIDEGAREASEAMHQLRRLIDSDVNSSEYSDLAGSVGQARAKLESNARALASLMSGAQTQMWDEAEFGQRLGTEELTVLNEEAQTQAADLKSYLDELNDQGVGAAAEGALSAVSAVAKVHGVLLDKTDMPKEEVKSLVMGAIKALDDESLKGLTVLSETLVRHAAVDMGA